MPGIPPNPLDLVPFESCNIVRIGHPYLCTIGFTHQQKFQLRVASKERKTSMSHIVRQALHLYFKNYVQDENKAAVFDENEPGLLRQE